MIELLRSTYFVWNERVEKASSACCPMWDVVVTLEVRSTANAIPWIIPVPVATQHVSNKEIELSVAVTNNSRAQSLSVLNLVAHDKEGDENELASLPLPLPAAHCSMRPGEQNFTNCGAEQNDSMALDALDLCAAGKRKGLHMPHRGLRAATPSFIIVSSAYRSQASLHRLHPRYAPDDRREASRLSETALPAEAASGSPVSPCSVP